MFLVADSTVLRRDTQLQLSLNHLWVPMLVQRHISKSSDHDLGWQGHYQFQFKNQRVFVVLKDKTLGLFIACCYLVHLKIVHLIQLIRWKHYRENIFIPSFLLPVSVLLSLLELFIFIVLLDDYLIQLKTKLLVFRLFDNLLNDATVSSSQRYIPRYSTYLDFAHHLLILLFISELL